MEKNFDNEVILRYLEGKETLDDHQKVVNWFKDSDNLQLDRFIHKNWESYDAPYTAKDLNFILQKVQSRIYLSEKMQKKTVWSIYRQIAAVLLLPVLFLSSYLLLSHWGNTPASGSWAEIHSPLGARTQFKLPDGTTGWLNSGSSIQYPVNFSKREVKISGEIYFDVAHKNDEEFVVKTPAVDVVVLGTKFDVSAYPDDNFLEVVLEEGKVKLNANDGLFSEILSPNEKFVLDFTQKRGAITKVNSSVRSSWKDGKLVFRDEPLSLVLKRMERWYNVQFVVEDKELNNYIYKATFEDETLDEVLKLLAVTSPIKYEIRDRKPDKNGSYSTKKIIIRKKKM